MVSDARRGLRAAAVLTLAGLLLCAVTRSWLPPPRFMGGVVALPLWGLALGIFAWRRQPGWQARALCLTGLVTAAIAMNALWLPGMHQKVRNLPLGLRERSDLLERCLSSWHPLILNRAVYLAVGSLVAGKEVRWVASDDISPRRLQSLAAAARLVEIPEPGSWVPTPEEWSARYETEDIEIVTQQRAGEVHDHLIAVLDAAESARWFVVLKREGVLLAIPGPIWEAERAARSGGRH